jgi:hypothetical protein
VSPKAAIRRACARTALGTVLAFLVGSTGAYAADEGPPMGVWTLLEPGLEFGVFAAPAAPATPDGNIRVLRIDLRRFRLRLLNASAPGQDGALTPKQWCERNGLLAAINASMYQTDYRTSVSLMRTSGHVNNPRLTRDKAVLAFDRRDDGVPPAQIIDREYQNFDTLSARYDTLVQSIRMVSLAGTNVWQPQTQMASTAAIGVDRQGRILFIHVGAPRPTHDLINALLTLPLELRSAMYVEGGPEAQLYVRAGGHELELAGRYDGGVIVHTDPRPWPVPNVVGVARIPQAAD